MVVIIITTIWHFMRGNTRYESVKTFCNAYIKSDQYQLMCYLPKPFLEDIYESVQSRSLNTYQRYNINAITIEVLHSKPHTIPYIISILEYYIATHTGILNTQDIVEAIYSNSNFYPKKRYPNFICFCLYHMRML